MYPTFGDRFLDTIDDGDIEDWLAEQEGKPSTLHTSKQFLTLILNCAVRWNYIRRSPMLSVDPVRVPERDYMTFSNPTSAGSFFVPPTDLTGLGLSVSWEWTAVFVLANRGT